MYERVRPSADLKLEFCSVIYLYACVCVCVCDDLLLRVNFLVIFGEGGTGRLRTGDQ